MVDKSKAYVLKLLLPLAIAVATFFLCGCATTASSGDEQIVKAAVELADEYCNLGLYENAVDVYDNAIAQVEDYRLVYNKALAVAYLGDYENAIAICQDGFESFPYVLAFKKAQAQYYRQLDRLGDAASCYMEVLELNPYDTSTRKELVSLYVSTGQMEKANEQVYVLWNQGYKTSETLELLEGTSAN